MFVRIDLTPSQQAVQACHAAIEAARSSLFPPGDEHPHLVLCGIGSEIELLNVLARLARLDIAFRPFCEPDLGGELTSLCTRPLRGDERLPLRHFRCLGASRSQSLPGKTPPPLGKGGGVAAG